ncbi:MAG: putative zinc-binding protein [Ignavibacteria bacterium]|nr:putative zinc-binding protein [Ignavibacteria bacterium]
METEKKIGIIACSGASNTGAYSDLVARKLMKMGKAKMLCLARFVVNENFAEGLRSEIGKYIVLDGCPINCAEVIVKKSGIDEIIHINTTDFGIMKGKTPVTEDKVDDITEYILKLIK